jgi:hypothetical protein
MPMLFWLPAIIVSGWWYVLTGQSAHPVVGQSDVEIPPTQLDIDLISLSTGRVATSAPEAPRPSRRAARARIDQ